MYKKEYLEKIICDWNLLQSIAEEQNKTVFTVFRWFRYGHKKAFYYPIIRRVADYYGVQINDLLE